MKIIDNTRALFFIQCLHLFALPMCVQFVSGYYNTHFAVSSSLSFRRPSNVDTNSSNRWTLCSAAAYLKKVMGGGGEGKRELVGVAGVQLVHLLQRRAAAAKDPSILGVTRTAYAPICRPPASAPLQMQCPLHVERTSLGGPCVLLQVRATLQYTLKAQHTIVFLHLAW